MATLINPAYYFPERVSTAQHRFEQRYARSLAMLQGTNLTWVVGPPQPREAGWPLLAQKLNGFAQHWRQVELHHGNGELVGRLVLVSEGVVSDESGEPFSCLKLLDWTNSQLHEMGARITRENESTVATLRRQWQYYRQAIHYLRAGSFLGAALLLYLVESARHNYAQLTYAQWLLTAAGTSLLFSWSCIGWWWVARWLRNVAKANLLPA